MSYYLDPEKQELYEKCEALKDAWLARANAIDIDTSISDEEADAQHVIAWKEYWAQVKPLHEAIRYMDFPLRTGWFAETFVPSFGECIGRRLTVKQTQVFQKYCVSDNDSWNSGKTYCRAGKYYIELNVPRFSRGVGYLTVVAGM